MKFLIFVCFLVSLASCEPNVEYKRIIQNDSDYDIWIINPFGGPPSNSSDCRRVTFDSIAIARKTSYSIEGGTVNQSVDFFSNCPILCLDTLNSRVHNRDSLELSISLYPTNSDWKYAVLQPGDNGACECRLIISNSDIN